jgi:small subunit ribosomal protein S20
MGYPPCCARAGSGSRGPEAGNHWEPLALCALTAPGHICICAPSDNTPGSKKAIRKIARRTEVNSNRRSRVRTFLRKFEEALTGGDADAAKSAFIVAQSELMRAVSKGVVHKNTGARKVSRLAARLKKLSAA